MKEIICDLTNFNLKKTVYIFEDGKSSLYGEYDLDDLADVVKALAQQKDIDNVRILGNDKYAVWLGRLIKEPKGDYAQKNFVIKYNDEQ